MSNKELNEMNECYSCIHRRCVPGNTHSMCIKPDMTLVGNAHGIRNGWFFYPLNYDPAWKESMCKNFKLK